METSARSLLRTIMSKRLVNSNDVEGDNIKFFMEFMEPLIKSWSGKSRWIFNTADLSAWALWLKNDGDEFILKLCAVAGIAEVMVEKKEVSSVGHWWSSNKFAMSNPNCLAEVEKHVND